MSLSNNAAVIAEKNFCPYLMVQWNRHFLCIQGHPEWITNYSRARSNDRRVIIPAPRIEAGLASLHTELNNTLFARWIIDFVRQ
ncbi:hypothetical protein MNBD_GAMMA21-1214 [hydrothermal vent metagenome]|uniref:Uncharacterized protein n=1 Tax=hydrothermal vent metagenome TaxID=652676 RepID=A0A3B0ZFQ1_9ZZZZ